jgi:hypothetical protein
MVSIQPIGWNAMSHNELPTEVNDQLGKIAQSCLGFDTLVTRNSDELDFRDVAVWSVAEALRAAYELGAKGVNHDRPMKVGPSMINPN